MKNENILQKNILEQLRKTELIEKERQYGYEMQIRNAFADMWISFLHMLNVRPEGVKQQIPEKEERLKKMLTYIHQEYENELSLEDIAKAAGVSKRECLRCFQEEIHITPFNYLKDYRLQRACIALKKYGGYCYIHCTELWIQFFQLFRKSVSQEHGNDTL